ncbi:MAG: hypothetical protein R3C03_17750 [Pirellulaceae bacterium]
MTLLPEHLASGIPITISRVYDTFDAGDEGDFGFGWSMGTQDPKILETAVLAEGGAFNPGNTLQPTHPRSI